MSTYMGDFSLEETVRFFFNSTQANGTPITLAGTPAVSLYSAGSTTESATGVTLTVDFDGRTGLHQVAVAATAANGFVASRTYHAVITAGTIDGVSAVGLVVGSFSISQRTSALLAGIAAAHGSGSYESADYPSGTAQSATASTLVLASSDDTPSDHYIGSIVYIESGTGVGQARRIVDSTFHASTPSVTVAPDWATNPSSDSVYTIYPAGIGALANLDVASSSLATATDLTTVSNAVTALQGDVTDLLDVATLAAVKLGVYRLVRSGTTVTGYAEDTSTILATWTLDDADNPTSIIRAS